MAAARRRSPSGPQVAAERLRWYGDDAETSALGVIQTGAYGRSEADFGGGTGSLEQLEGKEYAVQSNDYLLGQLVVQRLQGDPGAPTPPSGTGNITMQLRFYDQETDSSTDLGDPVTFAPAEFGKKVVTFDGLVVPVDRFLYVFGSYPPDWVKGNQDIGNYFVLDVLS